MPNIGEPMTSGTIPAVGTSGTSYATTINAFLTEVKQRLEAKIPMSALLTGALDMGNNAVSNISNAHFATAAGTPSTPSQSLQSFGGNLYWVSPAGAIQITNGAALNSAGIGGITGDYGGANPAQLRFVDLDATYYAYDDFSTSTWAHFRVRDIEIAGGAISAVRARINWAGSASYTLTLPASLPATQTLVQLTAAGQLTASNTLPVDTHVTFSGTGRIKHGDYVLAKGLDGSISTTGTLSPGVDVTNPFWEASASGVFWILVPLGQDTRRIKELKLWSNAATAPTLELYEISTGGTGLTGGALVATSTASTALAFGQRIHTVTVTTPATPANTGTYYALKVTSSAAIVRYYKIQATYDAI